MPTTETLSTTQLKKGQMIGIPCSVKHAPFPSEMGVFIDTLDGKIDGFVQESQLMQIDGQWRIRGMVDEVEEDRLIALVWGEFFRTAGYINLPLDISICPWTPQSELEQ